LFASAFIPEFSPLVIWFALVPALVAVRGISMWRLFWVSWLTGYLVCLALFYWVMIVSVTGGLLLPVYLGLYWPAFFVSLEVLARKYRVPRVLAAVTLWPLLEHLRGTLLTGLPWYYLGHAFFRWPRLIQAADLGGVLLVSLIVMSVNALLAEAVVLRRKRRASAAALAAAAVIFLANLAYGAWRMNSLKLFDGPTVACVQPNVPQTIKIDQTEKQSAKIFLKMRAYTLDQRARAADVVFWPETMMPGVIGVDDYTVANGMSLAEILDELVAQGALTRDAVSRVISDVDGGADVFNAIRKAAGPGALERLSTDSLMAATAKIARESVVAGAIYAVTDSNGNITKTYNRACDLDPGGREIAFYDKVHLVPFGEFVPFRDLCPALARLLGAMMPVQPVTYPGKDYGLLPAAGYAFGPAICFESTFSYISRRYRRLGADALVNMTNDGWFGGSFELESHLGNALFRAVETRMAVVRAANTGISAVISPKGEIVVELAAPDGRKREITGLLVSRVPLCRARTPYLVVGNSWLVLPALCTLLFGLARYLFSARKNAPFCP